MIKATGVLKGDSLLLRKLCMQKFVTQTFQYGSQLQMCRYVTYKVITLTLDLLAL